MITRELAYGSNMTFNKKAYFKWLHEHRTCSICDAYTIELHHITHKLISPRRDDKRVIPLCVDHHRGTNGIHNLGLGWYDKFLSLQECLDISMSNLEEWENGR